MDVAKIACVSIPSLKVGVNIQDLLRDKELFTGIKAIDCIQVPTTAGTGSEVTPFATVWDYESQQKKSLSHPLMYATKAFIENRDITNNQLMKFIPGPDFPTGGVIIGKDMIKQGYNKGRGSFKIRGEIEEKTLKNGKERLLITSIPYQVNKSVLIERIAQ